MDNYEKAKAMYTQLLSDKKLSTQDKIEMYKAYLSMIRKLAYSGNKDAQFDLSGHYEEYNFFGVNTSYNPKKAFYWAQKACKNKNADACNNLATYFEGGIGCEKDLIAAEYYYNKAIELGSSMARENLDLLTSQS